jgi:predicted RNA-binding Zn ribbon-like protein
MEGAWFTDLADELARCLTDAEACADACEQLLEAVRESGDRELQRRAVGALVAPAAIARVLIELIDHPAQLVLAACRLCRESAAAAVEELEQLADRLDASDALRALRAAAESCDLLLDAV